MCNFWAVNTEETVWRSAFKCYSVMVLLAKFAAKGQLLVTRLTKYNILKLALRSVKNINVVFLNQIRYFSIKWLHNYTQEAG